MIEVSVDHTAFDQGHIPGAVALNWFRDLEEHPQRDIASQGKIERLLSDAGVSPDTTIVVYGDNNNWFAAYAYWLFKLYGHRDVRVMNGGRKKWMAEGRSMTRRPPLTRRASTRPTSQMPGSGRSGTVSCRASRIL